MAEHEVRTPLGSQEMAALAAKTVRDATSRRDHDYAPFLHMGSGSTRVALLAPDGVVYKVPTEHAGPAFESEVLFFSAWEAMGYEWVPDWWPYEELGVTAMPPYGATATPEEWPEFEAMNMAGAGASHLDVGVTADGRLVLLDGGSHMPPLGAAST